MLRQLESPLNFRATVGVGDSSFLPLLRLLCPCYTPSGSTEGADTLRESSGEVAWAFNCRRRENSHVADPGILEDGFMTARETRARYRAEWGFHSEEVADQLPQALYSSLLLHDIFSMFSAPSPSNDLHHNLSNVFVRLHLCMGLDNLSPRVHLMYSGRYGALCGHFWHDFMSEALDEASLVLL